MKRELKAERFAYVERVKQNTTMEMPKSVKVEVPTALKTAKCICTIFKTKITASFGHLLVQGD